MNSKIAIFLFLVLLCGGSSRAQLASHSALQEGPVIRIGPGDIVDVEVFNIPELSGTVRVGQDGDANLPVLGPIHLAGLGAEAASRFVESELRRRGLVLEPKVTVSISEFATQGANVMGEVRSPGIYPTLGSRTLLDMISLAGGVSTSAGKLVTIIHRSDPHHPVYVALAQNAAGLKDQRNPIILPGDTIVVARAGIIYVIGDVGRPGGYLIDNNEKVSLMQALTLAGGSTQTSKLSQARLIRKLPTGREEIKLDLKRIYYGKEADVSVQDGDILFVPSSFFKSLGYRGIEAAITIATDVAVYAPGY
jgi:polysaccharide biosynthesis/export protein